MIERHPVRDSTSAVVAGDPEVLVAELAHRGEQVIGQRSLAVCDVVLAHRGAKRLSVAGQVGDDQGEPPEQQWRDGVPHEVGLGEPVEQEERRARPADPGVYMAPRRRYVGRVEVLEQRSGALAAGGDQCGQRLGLVGEGAVLVERLG